MLSRCGRGYAVLAATTQMVCPWSIARVTGRAGLDLFLEWPLLHFSSTATRESSFFFFLFKILFFLERGQGREKERGRETLIGCIPHVSQPGTGAATQACALTGNQTCNPLLCCAMPNQLSRTGPGEGSHFDEASQLKILYLQSLWISQKNIF